MLGFGVKLTSEEDAGAMLVIEGKVLHDQVDPLSY